MLNILAVFLGGGIGAACRYLITMISNRFFGIAHWGTFSANIIGWQRLVRLVVNRFVF
mgnify:CR=1 FL=1